MLIESCDIHLPAWDKAAVLFSMVDAYWGEVGSCDLGDLSEAGFTARRPSSIYLETHMLAILISCQYHLQVTPDREVMSFGYSVGDFVTVGALAWNVYKSCKAAPESFANISGEVLSLHAVLKEAEEAIFAQPLSPEKQARLKAVGDGCQHTLEDLQSLIEKYQRLGTRSRRTWDRVGWSTEDIVRLRSRLISNTVMLNTWISTSQSNVGKKLDDFIREFREGRREGSIISTQTADSLSVDDKQAWRTIRKELEEIGITVAAFDANREFIINWFSEAIATGAFEEQISDGNSIMLEREKHLPRIIEDNPYGSQDYSLKPSMLGARLSGPQVLPGSQSPDVSTAAILQSASGAKARGGLLAPSSQNGPPRKLRNLWVATLIATLSRPGKTLVKALELDNESKALEILNDEVRAGSIGKQGLDAALEVASVRGREKVVQLLLEQGADIEAKYNYDWTALHQASNHGHEAVAKLLLEKGANIEAKDGYEWTALHLASNRGHEPVAKLLLEKGANIEAKDGYGSTALHQASSKGHEPVAKLLLEKGANIEAKDNSRSTALHRASSHGHKAVVKLLLEKGANIKAKDNSRSTALHRASSKGHKAVVKLLCSRARSHS